MSSQDRDVAVLCVTLGGLMGASAVLGWLAGHLTRRTTRTR